MFRSAVWALVSSRCPPYVSLPGREDPDLTRAYAFYLHKIVTVIGAVLVDFFHGVIVTVLF